MRHWDMVGMEIETLVPLSRYSENYQSDENRVENRVHGWELGTDSTIHTSSSCPVRSRAVEFRSFPVKEIEDAKEQLDWLWRTYKPIPEHAYGCGTHIHVSLRSNSDYLNLTSRSFWRFFLRPLKLKSDDLRDRFTGPTDGSQHYCSPELPSRGELHSLYENADGDRYKAINFCAKKKHGTIEFRIFPKATSPAQVLEYIDYTVDKIEQFLEHEDSTKRVFKFKCNDVISDVSNISIEHTSAPKTQSHEVWRIDSAAHEAWRIFERCNSSGVMRTGPYFHMLGCGCDFCMRGRAEYVVRYGRGCNCGPQEFIIRTGRLGYVVEGSVETEVPL